MQKRGLCLTLLVIMMVSCVLPAQAAETDVINGYTKSAGYD